jgi:hypothetical protein
MLSATSPGGQEYLSDDADQVDAVVHQVVQSEHPRGGVHLVLLYHIILETEKKTSVTYGSRDEILEGHFKS